MSNKIWYIFKDNHHIGPFSAQEVKTKFDAGEFSTSIPVWREGDPQWVPLGNQTELASFVVPTELVDLPPLPPLPSEAYDELPVASASTNLDEVPEYPEEVETVSPVDLDGKLETLEKELPKESIDSDSFWAPDSEEENTGFIVNKNFKEPNEPIDEEFPKGNPEALREKLKNVRSRLGDDVQDFDKDDLLESQELSESSDLHDETSIDPIRSDQLFDGDEGDSSSANTLETNPTKEELAAIQAPSDSSNFLSEDEPVEDVDPILESFTRDLKSDAYDIVDKTEYESEEEDLEYKSDEDDEFDEFEDQPETSSRFWLKIIASIVILAILGISTSQLFFQKKKIPSLSALNKTEQRAFREVIDNNSNQFSFRFAVTDDDSMNVWFATNQSEPGVLVIRMESKDKRVLAKEKIVATAKTEVLGYVSRLDSFRVTEGQKLVPGEYLLTGTFKVGGVRARILEWLKYNTPLGKMKFLKNRKTTYQISSSFYYTRDKGEKFRDELAKYWEKIRVSKTAPLLVEIQKWRTLKTLSEQVSNLYINLINLPKKSIKEISDQFSKEYAEQVAPVFQTLTIDTQSLLQNDEKLLPNQVNRLEQLLKLQKSFGLNVTSNLDSLGKYKKLTKSIIESLTTDAKQRNIDFSAKVDSKINEIQSQLEQI